MSSAWNRILLNTRPDFIFISVFSVRSYQSYRSEERGGAVVAQSVERNFSGPGLEFH